MNEIAQDRKQSKISFILIVVFGMYPILGVSEWGWTFGELISFFWFEGFIFLVDGIVRFSIVSNNFVKYNYDEEKFITLPSREALNVKARAIAVISFIYLFFSALHATFLLSLFINTSGMPPSSPISGFTKMIEVVTSNTTLVSAILVSLSLHVILLIFGYIIPGKRKSIEGNSSLIKPLPRFYILHIAILILGLLLTFFDTTSVMLLIVFIIIKAIGEAIANTVFLNKIGPINYDK